MGQILPISLKLSFTPNTLGCYGLSAFSLIPYFWNDLIWYVFLVLFTTSSYFSVLSNSICSQLSASYSLTSAFNLDFRAPFSKLSDPFIKLQAPKESLPNFKLPRLPYSLF